MQKDLFTFSHSILCTMIEYMIQIASPTLAVNIKEWKSKQTWKLQCKVKFIQVVCSFLLALVFKLLATSEGKFPRKILSYLCNQKTGCWSWLLTVRLMKGVFRCSDVIYKTFSWPACLEVRRVTYTCAKLMSFTSWIYQH